MSANLFAACLLIGLTIMAAGVAWRFAAADGVIAFGAGFIVLAFLTLRVMGRQ